MAAVVLESVSKVFHHRPALFNWFGRERSGETRALDLDGLLRDTEAADIAFAWNLLGVMVGGLFEYRDLGTVALRGFAENVPAWQVLGLGSVESRFEALRMATTPLVGRAEDDLAESKRAAASIKNLKTSPRPQK